MTQRFCRVCEGWHDLSEDWPSSCIGHFRPASSGLQIVKDIEPYKAIAVDVATGRTPVITGRAQHREFMKRNSYIEIGNEKLSGARPEMQTVSKAEIKRAIEQVRNR